MIPHLRLGAGYLQTLGKREAKLAIFFETALTFLFFGVGRSYLERGETRAETFISGAFRVTGSPQGCTPPPSTQVDPTQIDKN